METNILYLFTRTPLHVGAGSSVGAVDLPIQRERHTGFPIIPGSAIKGVLRDTAERTESLKAEVTDLFGEPDKAGSIAFGEARLLAFPLRSARGSYALVTCPLALQRFARDAGLDLDVPGEPDDMACLAGSAVTMNGNVVLEEYCLTVKGDVPAAWTDILLGALDDAVLQGARNRLVILSNGDFSHFVMNSCQVNQHIAIDSETGTVKKGALFNEETIPSECLFYAALTRLPRGSADSTLTSYLQTERLCQFGGGSTTGLGFCTMKLAGKGEPA